MHRKIHLIIFDKEFRFSAQAYCILLLLTLLPTTLQAHDAPNSAQQLMEKGDSCRFIWKYNNALNYYQQAYDHPEVADDVDMQFQLLERIMRTHDVLRHWKEMPETSYRLYTLAKERGDSVHVAMALLMRGKRMHALGQKKEGIQTCINAIEMLKRTDYAHKAHELASYYAILAKLYTRDGRYDEALRMSQEEEHYVELSRKCHPDEWYHRNLLRVYIIRMEILAKMGRMAEADRIYQKYRPTINTDPICGDALLCYFRLHGMYDEALQFLDAAMQNISNDGDSIGHNMLRLLNDRGDIYMRMGEYERAAECYSRTSAIADTLSVHSLSNLTVEVQKVIDSERTIAKHREWQIIIIAGIIILVVFILLMLRQNLIVRRKNKRMMALIRQLTSYREAIIQNGDSDEMGENLVSGVSAEEYKRFKEVDKRIMKEQLFSNPDFGRDDLMRLLGVDKNTLPSLINSITGTNVPGYINSKRMEYAVTLVKMHPEYTLGAIAEACGIKSPATFIRNFKAAYDMTPSEYRKQLENGFTASSVLTLNNKT